MEARQRKPTMLFHLSNNLLGIIDLLTFLFSIPILGAGISLRKSGMTECVITDDTTLCNIGGFNHGSSLWRASSARAVSWRLCSGSTSPLSFKGSGEALPGKAYKEYKLGHYSNWIQKEVNETQNWNKIKNCIVDTKLISTIPSKSSIRSVWLL
ncbi:hypothetical protein QQP08_000742 [Theobroma cacao]|nr:hypothetical protein QQP08_000742 [Theobroma cacao]